MTIKKSPAGFSEHDFKDCCRIGSGGSAEVFKVKSLRPGYEGKYFAIKKIRKHDDNGQDCTNRIKKEIEIHSQFTHPSIVKFHGSFQCKKYWHIVLELCERGSLQEYIKCRHTLSEEEACKFIKQVIDGVKCLHFGNIIHRDLSLKNLLLTDNYDVKIADFGLASEFSGKKRESTVVGTVNFMAPEVFDGYYDFKTDCWSVGCVLYTLLYGSPPFNGEKKKDIEMRIKRSELSFPAYATREAKKLLTDMLQKDANKRIEIKDALSYAFFQKYENKAYKASYQKNGDSGMSSLSNSSSLNSPVIQKAYNSHSRKSAQKNKCHKYASNNGYQDDYTKSIDRYDNIVKSKIIRNSSSSQLAKGKNTSAFENHLKNKIQNLPSCQALYDSAPSGHISLDLKEYKTHQDLNKISSQMHSFELDNGCITSTKIQDKENYFLHSHEQGINLIDKASYSYQQFPSSLHKRGDSYHSFRTNEKECKSIQKIIPSDKSLKDILTPLTTARLKSRRRRITKNVVISILNDGQVCLELLKIKKSKAYVSHVYFISHDGMLINIFRPKKKILLSDEPPLPNKNQEVQYFTFEKLPELHWKKYQYAKRFVDIVRAKTPKVTIYEKFAKCVMMENSPDPDYEVNFYNGYQITKIGHKITIKDQNGYEVEDGSNIKFILNIFENMKEACKDVETYINSRHNSNFPIIIGRKPDVIPDGHEEINKENITLRYMHLSSLNGTVTAMKAFDMSKFVDSSPSHNSSQKSLPSSLSCERNTATPYRNMAEIMLDLEKCQLAGEKWIVTEYKDGIEMCISIKDDEYFFRDVNSQTRIPDSQRPDLINRFHRDSPSILRHALSEQIRKKP